jgi:hypothetical protein
MTLSDMINIFRLDDGDYLPKGDDCQNVPYPFGQCSDLYGKEMSAVSCGPAFLLGVRRCEQERSAIFVFHAYIISEKGECGKGKTLKREGGRDEEGGDASESAFPSIASSSL